MEFDPLTGQTEFQPLTRPTENIPLTRPTEFEPLTQPTEFSEENEKGHILDEPDPDQSPSGSSPPKNVVVNTGKMTRQTHQQATIMILPRTVITDASDVRGKATGKRIRSHYAHV